MPEDVIPCEKCGCLGNRSCGVEEAENDDCSLDDVLECPCCREEAP